MTLELPTLHHFVLVLVRLLIQRRNANVCLASLEALQAYPSRCVGCVSFVLLIVSPHYEQDKINTTQVTTVWLRL